MMTLLTAFAFFGGFVVLFLPETIAAQMKMEPREEKWVIEFLFLIAFFFNICKKIFLWFLFPK